jgi:hypothetical protein
MVKKGNGSHHCALNRSKRCAFCEIDFNREENEDDLKKKFMNSFELLEGIAVYFTFLFCFVLI